MVTSTDTAQYEELDLATVAVMAASEIDDLMNERTTDFGYLSRLPEVLKRTVEMDESEGHRNMLNPFSANAVSQAISAAEERMLGSSEELIKESERLAEIAEQASNHEGLDDQQRLNSLDILKRFCVLLAQYSLAQNSVTNERWEMPEYRI